MLFSFVTERGIAWNRDARKCVQNNQNNIHWSCCDGDHILKIPTSCSIRRQSIIVIVNRYAQIDLPFINRRNWNACYFIPFCVCFWNWGADIGGTEEIKKWMAADGLEPSPNLSIKSNVEYIICNRSCKCQKRQRFWTDLLLCVFEINMIGRSTRTHTMATKSPPQHAKSENPPEYCRKNCVDTVEHICLLPE